MENRVEPPGEDTKGAAVVRAGDQITRVGALMTAAVAA
jgi:hypothetical protein